MSLALETLRDASICTALLLALPIGYCIVAVCKAAWKEGIKRWCGRSC